MKISVQLYTVRDLMDKDAAGTLMAIGKMGYRYVETAGMAGKTTLEFAKLVKQAGLKVSGMHVGLDACEANLDMVLADAKVLNSPYIIVPWAPESSYKDGWEKLGQRLQAIGEKVAAAKRVFAFRWPRKGVRDWNCSRASPSMRWCSISCCPIWTGSRCAGSCARNRTRRC